MSRLSGTRELSVIANPGCLELIAMYAISLVLCIGFAVAAERYLGLTFARAISASVGALFLAAVATYPGRLHVMLRYLGWFGLIRDDRLVRVVICVIGLALLAFASFGGHAT